MIKYKCQWLFLVPVKGGIGSEDYKRNISGKKPANWGMDYATDPTFYGNQKQPLKVFPVLPMLMCSEPGSPCEI